jgi:hypothetical protein
VLFSGKVNSIEYDVYNRYLLLGTKSKMLIVIDTSTMKTIKIFNTTGRVTVRNSCIDRSVDDRFFAHY